MEQLPHSLPGWTTFFLPRFEGGASLGSFSVSHRFVDLRGRLCSFCDPLLVVALESGKSGCHLLLSSGAEYLLLTQHSIFVDAV